MFAWLYKEWSGWTIDAYLWASLGIFGQQAIFRQSPKLDTFGEMRGCKGWPLVCRKIISGNDLSH